MSDNNLLGGHSAGTIAWACDVVANALLQANIHANINDRIANLITHHLPLLRGAEGKKGIYEALKPFLWPFARYGNAVLEMAQRTDDKNLFRAVSILSDVSVFSGAYTLEARREDRSLERFVDQLKKSPVLRRLPPSENFETILVFQDGHESIGGLRPLKDSIVEKIRASHGILSGFDYQGIGLIKVVDRRDHLMMRAFRYAKSRFELKRQTVPAVMITGASKELFERLKDDAPSLGLTPSHIVWDRGFWFVQRS